MANPYQHSGHSPRPNLNSAARDAQVVVSGQKLLLYGITAYICAIPIVVLANVFLDGTPEEPEVTPMFALVLTIGLLCVTGAATCAAIGIFRMGKVLFPGSTRILYAVGVLIPAPLVGLIVMFVANSNASTYLKQRGYKIGLFGAKR